jgi:alpha-tubulin suppressor-like RCC1 family protein
LGDRHACARLADGDVYCWGENDQLQLGRVGSDPSPTPLRVDVGGPRAHGLAAGSNHTCAALEDGRIACWGANGAGQLGPGTALGPGLLPVVHYLDAPATQISAGGNTTCALTEGAHDVFCWGSNVHGQLGNGRLMSGEVPDATLTRSVACAF